MDTTKFAELSCYRCGGDLKLINDNTYQCTGCGKKFEKQVVTDVVDQLRAVLNKKEEIDAAKLRSQLWAAMHEENINSEKIVGLARQLKNFLPDDYFANFCEVANSGSDKQINEFLNNTPKEAMADYADIVLDFMIKSMTAANLKAISPNSNATSSKLNAISLFIERAFKGDTQNYDKYITRYEEEAQKVTQGIYELNITRDVFLAYSSKDIDKVLELCDYLERNKITCFLALRNLRHGRGAVDNYDDALKIAIDNCRTVVFVSSTNSRDMACDALVKELPYIKKKDFENAPPECKRNYYRIPSEYLMPRVQYLVEDYLNDGNVAEGIVDEFFHDLEWCRSKEEVACRVSAYLTETRETAAEKAARMEREKQEQLATIQQSMQQQVEDIRRQISEAQNNGTQSAGGSSINSQVNALLKRAEQESDRGDMSSAKSYYDQVKDIAPDNYKAWLGLFYLLNNTTKNAGLRVWDNCNNLDEAASRLKANSATLATFESYEFKNALRYATGEATKEIKKLKSDTCQKIVQGNAAIIDKLFAIAEKHKRQPLAKQIYEFIIQNDPENCKAWLCLLLYDVDTVSLENLTDTLTEDTISKLQQSTAYREIHKYAEGDLKRECEKLDEAIRKKIESVISSRKKSVEAAQNRLNSFISKAKNEEQQLKKISDEKYRRVPKCPRWETRTCVSLMAVGGIIGIWLTILGAFLMGETLEDGLAILIIGIIGFIVFFVGIITYMRNRRHDKRYNEYSSAQQSYDSAVERNKSQIESLNSVLDTETVKLSTVQTHKKYFSSIHF